MILKIFKKVPPSSLKPNKTTLKGKWNMLKPRNNNQTYFKMMLIENPKTQTTPNSSPRSWLVPSFAQPFLTNILIQIDTSILHFWTQSSNIAYFELMLSLFLPKRVSSWRERRVRRICSKWASKILICLLSVIWSAHVSNWA